MHSVSFGIYYVTAVRYITRMIPDHLRATGMALFTVVWSSGAGLLSGTFGGLIYQDAGRTVFYMVATGFSILAFIGFLSKHLMDVGRPRPAVTEKGRDSALSIVLWELSKQPCHPGAGSGMAVWILIL